MKNPVQSMAKFAVMLLVAAISVTSCKKKTDDPAPVENEDITEVLVTLTNATTPSDVVTYRAFFAKGYSQAATSAPAYTVTSTKQTLTLGATYNGSVKFLNGTEDITEEITDPNPPAADAAEEGAKNHQVYYGFNSAFVSLTYTNNDPNGKPVGTEFSVRTSTTAVAAGSLNLKLIHKPNKAANNATTPYTYSAAANGGSTDVDATFSNVVVQ